jgi:predicted lipid carrier protein YhbT
MFPLVLPTLPSPREVLAPTLARLGRASAALHGPLVLPVLNRLLAQPLGEGRLDFLAGRVVAIRVRDLGVDLRLSAVNGALVECACGGDPGLVLAGDAYDFLLLAARREDPDTLFFQRRLAMTGDAALGLRVKNLLDELEEGPLPPALQSLLGRALDLWERLPGGRR